MRLERHATVLLVDDVRRSTAYYRNALGFEVDLYDRHPDHYAYANRDGCHLHFGRFAGARVRPNSEAAPPDMFDAYIYVDDVDDLYAEFIRRGAELVHGPVEQGYGVQEFRVRDPDRCGSLVGNLVAQRWDEVVRGSVAEIKRIAEMRAARHRPGRA
jgi:catechol 2,3-dioxygenase-like lactoylglutathione lyase family enzyme